MNLLLDTHVFIWLLDKPTLISNRVGAYLEDSNHRIFVSAVTAWEIATKVRIGKLQFPKDVLEDFDGSLQKWSFEPLGITNQAAIAGAGLKGSHNDPFDRMLAGIALVENLDLVSVDPAFKQLGVETLW